MCFHFIEIKKLEADYTKAKLLDEDQISSYYKIRQQLKSLSGELHSYITKPQYILPFLQPGRMVKVFTEIRQKYKLYMYVSQAPQASPSNPPHQKCFGIVSIHIEKSSIHDKLSV